MLFFQFFPLTLDKRSMCSIVGREFNDGDMNKEKCKIIRVNKKLQQFDGIERAFMVTAAMEVKRG